MNHLLYPMNYRQQKPINCIIIQGGIPRKEAGNRKQEAGEAP